MNIHNYKTFLETKEDINSICKKYGITNYTINEDNSIDVDGNVSFSHQNLSNLPLKFRNVTGNFYCGFNVLISLEGLPEKVGGNLSCSYNELTSLIGGPKSVGGYFYCSSNRLKTLEGSPKSVGGNFDCSYNQLTTLKGGPETVGGNGYYFANNKINDLTGFPEFWEGYIEFHINPISDILRKFPGDKVCKAIYWMNEFGVTHDGKVNQERLEEVFITLGLKVNI